MSEMLEDERFWDALDGWINASWRGLKEVLDVMNEYSNEIPAPLQALFMGGMGTFVRCYAIARSESNPPHMAFQHAIERVNADSRVQALIQQSVNDAVDGRIQTMKEGSE